MNVIFANHLDYQEEPSIIEFIYKHKITHVLLFTDSVFSKKIKELIKDSTIIVRDVIHEAIFYHDYNYYHRQGYGTYSPTQLCVFSIVNTLMDYEYIPGEGRFEYLSKHKFINSLNSNPIGNEQNTKDPNFLIIGEAKTNSFEKEPMYFSFGIKDPYSEDEYTECISQTIPSYIFNLIRYKKDEETMNIYKKRICIVKGNFKDSLYCFINNHWELLPPNS